MKPAPFAYSRAISVEDACALLADETETSMPLAGGQSLLVLLGLRVASTDRLIDISRLAEMKRIEDKTDAVFLGALTTHAAIEDGLTLDPSRGLMPTAARGIAYRAVRNHGTIGGSVALADPAADWPACLIAMQAKALIAGPDERREVFVEDLIESAYVTGLQPGELILGFDIPKLIEGSRWGFAKSARKSGAFATSIAVVISKPQEEPRVVIAGQVPRASALKATSKALARSEASNDAIREAIEADLAVLDPDMSAYLGRAHAATVLKAIAQVRGA